MADSGEQGRRNVRYRTSSNSDESSEDENLQGASSMCHNSPDIGLGDNNHLGRKSTHDQQTGGSSNNDPPRREENPFSFKHFLNAAGGSSGGAVGGARPKVSRLIANPELTSGLPDFVQDHLVIEQCYLDPQPQPLAVDLTELGLQSPCRSNTDGWSAGSGRVSELPFDLTATRHERPTEPPPRLPLDLPSGVEVGASTSLPDFLSDGPIHGRAQTSNEPSSPETQPSTLTHLQSENERLRRDQDILRRQLADQIRRTESLETELRARRSRDSEDAASLDRAVRGVEENLLRAVKRAEAAERKSEKLKLEVKRLTLELRGAGPGPGASGSAAAESDADRRLASELRAAVSTAELSLRQMLGGVNTLRHIASTLENRHRLEPAESPEPDSDSGPAL